MTAADASRGGIAAATRVPPRWLGLREPADAAARSSELVDRLRANLPAGGLAVHDLGAGTGAMCRWLAPRLPGPQEWVLYDHDARLLALAAGPPGTDTTMRTRRRDVLGLTAADLGGASLVTASALLDMLTVEELARLTEGCRLPGCPVLLTMTVVGRVALLPPDPLDEEVAAAFDDHQRRPARGGRLLGPDAVAAAADAFAGYELLVRPSPWRLHAAGQGELVGAWLRGWVAAAVEQRPALAAPAAAYARRREEELADGRLSITVHHDDLLALPR